MKAVVLAAGKGTRMLPLTADKPKHMIVVNGRPFIDYIVQSLQKVGLKDIAVVVNYKKEFLEAHLRKNYPEIVTIDQGEPRGTGHAVSVAERFVGKEEFVVIMGDNLYSPRDMEAVASLGQNVVAGYDVDNPSLYGVLVTNNGKLAKIVEKPKDPPGNLINTGLYKFTPEIFDVLRHVTLSPREEYELTDAITALAQKGRVFVYKLQDYWLDFGRPEDVQKLEKFLKERGRRLITEQ